jgi:NDP-sugar pyrophosphorylase family protein
MYAETINGVWFDVGHPKELLRAQETLLKQYDTLPFSLPEGSWVGDDGFEFAGATVDGVTTSSVISESCTIETSAAVTSSLLMKGCHIGEGATIVDSILGQHVRVESGASITNCVVGDGQIISTGDSVDSVLLPSPE